MNNLWFRFRVGKCACFAVGDGTFTYAPPLFPPPMTFLFPSAPRDRLEQKLRESNIQPGQRGAWISPYICLLIDTGRHRVLIDTGAGRLGPNTGALPKNLHALDFAPDDIDTVVLTHGHPDHIGGITDLGGRTIFPNARFVMEENEWNFWTGNLTELHGNEQGKKILRQAARENLPPIRDQLDLISGESKIVPGITAIPAPGHTLGHIAVSLSSEGEHLLCLSDAMLHPIHIDEPDWYAMIDFHPEMTVETRYRLLKLIMDRNALVLGFHFPFPGLGHVVRTPDRWKWQPINPPISP
jgi:glyoxylase-like metal-dependent hydrolase (beta-lactamase superfamily II)